MRISVNYDLGQLRERRRRRGPLPFEVSWTLAGNPYPAEHWADSGAVILAWWLAAMAKLVRGAKARFSFMEGPHAVDARRVGAMVELSPVNSNQIVRVELRELGDEVLRAAERISAALGLLGVHRRAEEEPLKAGIENLRKAMRFDQLVVANRPSPIRVPSRRRVSGSH